MPFVVTCPVCHIQLKSARPIAAGRDLTCPQCKNGFTLTQPATEMDLAGTPPTMRPGPSPLPPPIPAIRPVMGRLEPDDAPRPRRDRVNDDRPSPRRPVEVEDDDRPLVHRERAADEFEDEAPRRPRDRRRNKSRTRLVVLVGGLAALFLCCTGGGLTLYLADPFRWFSGPSSDLVAWMPADTQHVEGIDFAEVGKHPRALTGVRQRIADAESLGLKAEDVADALIGKKSGAGPAEVVVLRLKSAADRNRIVQAAGGSEATANGRKYFRTRAGGAIHFPSDRTVVLTRSEAAMTGLLQKEEGKVVISKDLQECLKRADGHLWAATVGAETHPFGGAGMAGGIPGTAPVPAPRSSVMAARLSGDEVAVRMELTFADAETARRASDQIDGMFKMFRGFMEMAGGLARGGNAEAKKMQDMKRMFETVQITTNGPTVIITFTGPVESVEGFNKGAGPRGF
jgi:hypothetical protein